MCFSCAHFSLLYHKILSFTLSAILHFFIFFIFFKYLQKNMSQKQRSFSSFLKAQLFSLNLLIIYFKLIKHAISKVIVHLLCLAFAHSSRFAFSFLLRGHKKNLHTLSTTILKLARKICYQNLILL